MSHIPNQVMPHAGPMIAEETGRAGRFGKVSEMVRDHPRASVAAGAAVAAGLAAAAAIPVIRARRKSGESGK
jgi:hypothetical protein